MKVTVCIGSTCHLRGSRQVVEKLQSLIAKSNLTDEIQLGGTFCMGECGKGVSVKVEDKCFSITPEEVEDFYKKEILGRM